MIINKCKFAYTQQRASVMINLEPGIQWTHSSTLIGKNAANCCIYPRTSTKFDHLIFLSFLSSKTRRKHTKLQIWVMSTETPLFVRWDKLSVQFSRSVMSNSLQPHELQHARLPYLHYLPEFAQTHVHWVNDAIQLSHPLSPPSPPASMFSSIRVFSSESALCIGWSNYWRFNFSIVSSNEYSGFNFFKIDWFDLLVV